MLTFFIILASLVVLVVHIVVLVLVIKFLSTGVIAFRQARKIANRLDSLEYMASHSLRRIGDKLGTANIHLSSIVTAERECLEVAKESLDLTSHMVDAAINTGKPAGPYEGAENDMCTEEREKMANSSTYGKVNVDESVDSFTKHIMERFPTATKGPKILRDPETHREWRWSPLTSSYVQVR